MGSVCPHNLWVRVQVIRELTRAMPYRLCIPQLHCEIRPCLPGRHFHLLLDHQGAREHLAQVFQKLWEAQLYLSQDKVDLYSERMDCLSHIITHTGIHACTDKMQKIWDWRQPRNFHEVQRFLRLVQYLAHFMPDVTVYTSPLTTCVCNGRQFVWTPLYDKCLESIKALACWAPVLKPIDTNNPDPIWVICM